MIDNTIMLNFVSDYILQLCFVCNHLIYLSVLHIGYTSDSGNLPTIGDKSFDYHCFIIAFSLEIIMYGSLINT